MKVAFIHNAKKLGTGAHFINDLISEKLHEQGIDVQHFYPNADLLDAPVHLRGIINILFFHSLLQQQKKILKCDVLQGTTYTPLAYLSFNIPVVSHFGSTTRGFLESVPLAKDMRGVERDTWYMLRIAGVIHELNVKTRRPMRDVAMIEEYVANRADAVVATSEKVKEELLKAGVRKENIHVIYNAVEEYWFKQKPRTFAKQPALVFLGRLGHDAFTLKLKGLDRVVWLWSQFPNMQKITIGMTIRKSLMDWMSNAFEHHSTYWNILKTSIPTILRKHAGGILFVSSRYEGFSLSLIEGMASGLVPITFAVGVAPEIIVNGKNGFIVETVEEAAERVRELQRSPAKRIRMAKEAIKTAGQFKASAIAKQFANVYAQVTQKKNRS